MSERRLLLVDGTQLFYRSFFAIRGLTTHTGEPSNAVYGFIRGIHQLIETRSPSHLVVAWDGGSPAERLALLPEYKAQRPPMPDALKHQYEPIREFLERARIPLVRVDHEEADDLLASLARWAAPDAGQVLVVTCDKDLYQMVNTKVGMIGWGKDDKLIGRDEVFEKTGVYPWQIVDWLSLTGDTVDNIPGVEGMGPKTASKLLAKFGSLDLLWERLSEVEPIRIREHLAAARERVNRNRRLVTLREDLACSPGWDAMEVKPEVPSSMRPFYARMDFHSLIKGMDQGDLFQ